MRKLIVFLMTSLDGYVSDANGGIDWQVVDDEFNVFAAQQLDSVGMILFGRVTYEGMASYWPTPFAIHDDPVIAKKMNTMPKIVISRTLDKADWNNTRLIKDDITGEINQLKQQPGKDLIIFGSSNLCASLMGLIDEFRIMVSPVILGSGQSLFAGADRVRLRLLKTETFRSGNVLHYYAPAG
jgi:dihydrofolate reductase